MKKGRFIPLSGGKLARVDDQDYASLSAYKWSATGKSPLFYAVRNRRPEDGPGPRMIFMHRQITGAQKGFHVDHRNGRSLDNRRKNLRLCTPAENARNRRNLPPGASGFRGVCFSKRLRRWESRIKHAGRTIFLGRYATAEEAAAAYDGAARVLFGDFAALNSEMPGRRGHHLAAKAEGEK